MKLTILSLITLLLAITVAHVRGEETPAVQGTPQDTPEVPASVLVEEFKGFTDAQLMEHLGDSSIFKKSLELLLDELLTRPDLHRYPLEIKRAMQRRMIVGDLASVAKIASYRGFCKVAFPDLMIDFSGNYTPQSEAESAAWRSICESCPRRGLNFQRLCTHAADQGK